MHQVGYALNFVARVLPVGASARRGPVCGLRSVKAVVAPARAAREEAQHLLGDCKVSVVLVDAVRAEVKVAILHGGAHAHVWCVLCVCVRREGHFRGHLT